MTLLAPKGGAVRLLGFALNNLAPSNVRLHLYVNNHTPAEGDTLANYTESSAAGYASVVLTGASWTITQDATSGADGAYAAQTFTYTAAEIVYGYYVTDNTSANLLWAELFSGGPFAIGSAGGTITVTPNVQLY